MSLDALLSLLSQYGYVIVFVGVLLESAGLPVPGETVLVAAGIVAHRGTIDLGTAIGCGIAGAVIGDQIGYAIGRRGGRPFVLRWGRYVKITPERLTKADAFFARHGGKAVFLARFVAGLRVFGALMAGVSRMHWTTFLIYNTLGAIVWATSAVLVGFFAGSSYHLIEQWSGRAGITLAILITLVVAYHLLNRRYHLRGRLLDRMRSAPFVLRTRAAAGRSVGAARRHVPAPVVSTARWLVRHRYSLLLLLACVLAPLALLGEIVHQVFREQGFPWDSALLDYAQDHATSMLDRWAPRISELGDAVLLTPLVGFVTGVLLMARRPMQAGFFALACAGALLLNVLARTVFERPRPPAIVPSAPDQAYAFPSSHAMGSMALVVALIVLTRPTRWRWAVAIAGAVVTAAVGASRIYLRLEYPTDVLAGWLAAIAWVVGVHLTFTSRLPFDLGNGNGNGNGSPGASAQVTEKHPSN